jgi:hypothetical protein
VAGAGGDPLFGSRRVRRRLASVQAAAVAGIVCAVGWSLSLGGLLAAPGIGAPDEEIAAFYADTSSSTAALVWLQVLVFSTASFLVIGLRGGSWEPGLFLAVPIVTLMFSYLFSVCVLFVALLIISLFVAALFGVEIAWLSAALFIVSMVSLIASLVFFLRDINKSLHATRLEVGADWEKKSRRPLYPLSPAVSGRRLSRGTSMGVWVRYSP